MTQKYAFFRGCFIPARAPHIEHVARKTLPELGVELQDVGGFTCCPEPTGFSLHEKLTWLTVAARNISLAEDQDLDILTLCNGCYYTLKHTVEELEDAELRSKVNEALSETGHQFTGRAKVKHFVQVLDEDIGVKRISQAVKVPLEGLRVAAHTGCHFTNRYGLEARLLDDLVSATGASSVEYDLKNLCCGWMIGAYGQQEDGYAWLKNRLESMRRAQADCVTVICPQCYHQYDTGQMMALRKVDILFKTPVLFYLQLLGLAMGHSLEKVQFNSHRVKDAEFEEKVRRILGA
ncbi:MAG: heterodisulfide reductase-related iron-sulfur binding cluster [Candidatus Bathyarchaeota archaeon]